MKEKEKYDIIGIDKKGAVVCLHDITSSWIPIVMREISMEMDKFEVKLILPLVKENNKDFLKIWHQPKSIKVFDADNKNMY